MPGQYPSALLAQFRQMNEYQQRAVLAGPGLFLLAGKPGSGKTTTIIARLARLVADGVRPENILAMTFTNAGVESMKTKLLQLGIHPDSMEICTIHSLCHQILGKETHVLAGLSLDGNRLAWERKKALLAMRKSKGYSATGGGVDDVGRYIADVKARGPVYVEGNPFGLNSLGSEFAREMAEIWAPRLKVSTRHAHNVYMGMEEHRAVLGVYDYDDMLNWAWLVLLADADVRQRWRMRYSLVIVDEMQDNCPVQWDLAYLLSGLSSSIPITKHLAPEPDGLPTGYNLMAGGDILQCLDIDTPIETKAGGVVELSTISIGDEIAVLTREGKRYREVTKVWDVTRQERCEVKLVDGTKLGGHPFHLVFAALQPRQDHYQVYLMYRSDLGYRLGVTRGPATKGESLIVRTSQEGASRLWFVRSESTAAEASYWEQALSLKYQIPTYPFRLTGRNLRLDEDGLARLFKNYGWNGEQLLDDYALSFDRPLYSPKATHSNRLVINIVLSSAKGKAELSIESRHLGSIKDLIESTRDSLHVTLSGSKGEVDCWRVRTHALDGAGAELLGLELLTRIREARPDLDIVIRTSLFSVKTGEHTAFRATTLSALRPGVSVLTERGPVGVASCSMAEGSYTFRDIAVADVASYLANGIAVHNSIYGFRSAEPTMLLEFAKREDVTILELPINYRSVPQICRCANRIVEGEPWHISGEMVSARGDAQSPSVRICEFDSKEEEISWILDQAVELGPHSCAVLARMNSTLDLVEVECVKRRVKYFKRNKGSFFTSKIVQDLLAYLRVACWCDDTGRWAKHVINKPFRFFSAKDLRDAETEGLRQGTNALYGLKQNMREMSFQKRQRVRELLGLMTELNRMAIAAEETAGKEAYEPENGPYAMLRLVLERTKYIEEVRQQEGLMALDESKAGLARELQRMATAFQSPRSLLAYIDHMAIAVKRAKDIGIRVDNEESGALVLSTIHSAKGLQWPNVIIASVDQGTFPCEWSESYEEEVRLFYVAITRAADRCYATLTKPLSGADGKPVYSSLITKLKEALALEDGNAHGNEGSKRDEQAGDAHTIRADGGHAGREPHQADAAQSKGGDVRAGATGWPAPARP